MKSLVRSDYKFRTLVAWEPTNADALLAEIKPRPTTTLNAAL